MTLEETYEALVDAGFHPTIWAWRNAHGRLQWTARLYVPDWLDEDEFKRYSGSWQEAVRLALGDVVKKQGDIDRARGVLEMLDFEAQGKSEK